MEARAPDSAEFALDFSDIPDGTFNIRRMFTDVVAFDRALACANAALVAISTRNRRLFRPPHVVRSVAPGMLPMVGVNAANEHMRRHAEWQMASLDTAVAFMKRPGHSKELIDILILVAALFSFRELRLVLRMHNRDPESWRVVVAFYGPSPAQELVQYHRRTTEEQLAIMFCRANTTIAPLLRALRRRTPDPLLCSGADPQDDAGATGQDDAGASRKRICVRH